MSQIKVGIGYDVHRLVEGRKLILGGVEIPYVKGLDGHSDADVLVHAIMDAILGALGEGDIGHLFPDSDPAYLNIDSMKLLDEVIHRMKAKGFKIGNLDALLIAQKPKTAPYVPEMRDRIAKACECDLADVNVKATTEEHLGFTGREEGMAAEAVVLLERL